MKKNLAILCVLSVLPFFTVIGQLVQDDFSDGDFTNSPEWTGNLDDFMVNPDFQLQLNFEESTLRPAYISTEAQPADLNDKEWRFDLNLNFAPSATNKVEIYLVSSTTDLLDFQKSGSSQEGYYLEIGENGSNDGISLFYRNSTSTQLIARGGDGDFASAFDVRIRVRRDAAANWEIAVDANKGENFTTLATGNDGSLNQSASLGFICYFTASRSSNFYFDNVYLGDYITDTIPPQILAYEFLNANQIQLLFSEEVSAASATSINNYSLNPGSIQPQSIQHDTDTVWLTFEESFENGLDYQLEAANISDSEGNVSGIETVDFFYFEIEEAQAGDVIINEFFPDPTPVLGLPDEEFVELYNRSDKFIDLDGWQYSDNTTSSGTLPTYILKPKSYVILAPSSAKQKYEAFGEVLIPSSWQALNNASDSVVIKNAQGLQIDGLKYDLSWYQDEEKSEGGYSIEIINTELACFDQANWRASKAPAGGTPGQENSVNDTTFTGNSPEIITFRASAENQLAVRFDKSMDTASLAAAATYTLTPEIEITDVAINDTKSINLNLGSSLENDVTYTLTISEVEDCNGNISQNLTSSFLHDIVPPKLDSLVFLSDSILLLTFNESLESKSATRIENYSLSPQINIQEVKQWGDNQVLILWENKWIAGFPYTLTINNLSDLSGNLLLNFQKDIILTSPAKPGFNELIITEIMSIPKADQILPNRQYVEIYNPTDKFFSLVDVKYMDGRDTLSLGLNYIKAGERLLLAPKSAIADLSSYARVIGISPWPNLNNRGKDLQLITDETIVNQVFYRDTWYKENFKYDEGGWSLEMIDTRNPCLGKSNWTASTADAQGTPGAENSVKEDNIDQTGPNLLKAFAPTFTEVLAYFDEPLDITKIRRSQFSISAGITIESVKIQDLNAVKLTLANELKVKVRYTLRVDNLTDCVGNIIRSEGSSASFALAEEAEQGDVILNEVLYDQKSGGADFIELLNMSDKYINLKNWIVEGTSQKNIILENENIFIEPGQYLALTPDKASVIRDYPNSHNEENIVQANLPTLPNKEGIVRVRSANQKLEEYFEYSDDLHVPFLRSVDGVSLERINPEAPINDAASWSSAASAVGYATPGQANSQFTNANVSFGKIEANPKTFAHGQPGRNFTLINYTLADAGNKATVKIFDVKGTLIITLANNETLSSTGFFRWDGIDFEGRKVGIGYYVIYFQVFTADGNTRVIKERVAVGSTF